MARRASRPPVFVDTGYVIALANTDDRYHAVAARWSEQIERVPRPQITTLAILMEVGEGFAKKGQWALGASILVAI